MCHASRKVFNNRAPPPPPSTLSPRQKKPPSLHHCVVGSPSRSKFSRRRRGKKRGLPVPKRTFSPLLSVKKQTFRSLLVSRRTRPFFSSPSAHIRSPFPRERVLREERAFAFSSGIHFSSPFVATFFSSIPLPPLIYISACAKKFQ